MDAGGSTVKEAKAELHGSAILAAIKDSGVQFVQPGPADGDGQVARVPGQRESTSRSKNHARTAKIADGASTAL